MNWCCPGPPRSGLTVTAGRGLATRAAWTIARQVESGELLERFADAGGQDGLDFPGFSHRQPRRKLRGQRQAFRAERRHELLPGLDHLIERQ